MRLSCKITVGFLHASKSAPVEYFPPQKGFKIYLHTDFMRITAFSGFSVIKNIEKAHIVGINDMNAQFHYASEVLPMQDPNVSDEQLHPDTMTPSAPARLITEYTGEYF